MNLTKDQDTALQELKKRVGSKLPSHMNNDFEIIKWLKARNFIIEKAEEMVLKHLEWRKEWDVDSILDWTPPEVMAKYYPMGHSGYDKEGAPVWIVAYGTCDIRGLLYSCSKKDFIRFLIYMFELSLAEMRKRSEGLPVPIGNEILILDLERFTLAQFTWKPALDVLMQIFPMYEANYPEIMKNVFVVNAPRIFTITYAMVKPFLHENTIKKIKVFGQSGWKEQLLKGISPDQLPVHWGGTMTDSDKNPKCPAKINLGGTVPETYYLKNKKANESGGRDKLKTLIIPKSGKEEIKLKVEYPGSALKWEFQSEDFDVGFGISRIVLSGEEEELMPIERVNSHLVTEEGSFVCIDPGMYKVTFDNEYSVLRSKTLYYNLEISAPSEHIKL